MTFHKKHDRILMEIVLIGRWDFYIFYKKSHL